MAAFTATAAAPTVADRPRLDRLCTSIRGKLQFMDYLVRAAVADVERYQAESDTGTRIFLRQLIEMHLASLQIEGENVPHIVELCELLESYLRSDPIRVPTFSPGDLA